MSLTITYFFKKVLINYILFINDKIINKVDLSSFKRKLFIVNNVNTPMMEQYLKIKNQHKAALIFIRMGDF